MKPKNFPKRKLLRKLRAMGLRFVDINKPEIQRQLEEARNIRTKKYRGERK